MNRESFGIQEFDALIQGGLPQQSVIGISGPPGVGKSIFSMHFLLAGARKGQKCVYINLEEPHSNIINLIEQFDFSEEFKSFVEQGLIIIKCIDHDSFDRTFPEVLEKIKTSTDIERLVVDSFNCFFSFYQNTDTTNENFYRKLLHKAIVTFRSTPATTLITLEKAKEDLSSSIFSVFYTIDGHIQLDYLGFGAIERRLFIPKMRWTNQEREGQGFDICRQGIVLNSQE